jgi:hypothetical protein
MNVVITDLKNAFLIYKPINLLNLKKIKMKTCKVKSFFFLMFVFVSAFVGYSQTNIKDNSNQYEYLIGKEYSNISELGDFKYKLRETGTYEINGIKYGITNIIINNQSIILLEFLDMKDSTLVHRITDLVVCTDAITTCISCMFPKNTDDLILSFHPDVFNQSFKDTVLAVFNINFETGKLDMRDKNKYIQIKKLETVHY